MSAPTETQVTIAIPFYRDLGYLEQAIASVRAQTSADWLLHVADDSAEPGDGTREKVARLIDSYADPRIRLTRNDPPLGMVRNWNRCIDEARTPLLSLLHGDDRLLPDYVERMCEIAALHPEAVAYYCGARIIDAHGRPVFSLADRVKLFFEPREATAVLSGEPSATTLMAGNFIMCPTLCFRLERLGERRFSTDWAQVQDLELTVRLLMDGDSLVGARAASYEYRRHAASATSLQSDSLLRFAEELALFDLVAERAKALGWSGTARAARAKRIVRLHVAYRALRELIAGRPRRAGATLSVLRGRR